MPPPDFGRNIKRKTCEKDLIMVFASFSLPNVYVSNLFINISLVGPHLFIGFFFQFVRGVGS